MALSFGEVLLIYNGILFVLIFFPIPFILLPICGMSFIVGNIIILIIYAYKAYKSTKQWYDDQGGIEGITTNAGNGTLDFIGDSVKNITNTGLNITANKIGS